MRPKAERSSDHLNDLVGQNDINKFRTVDRDLGLNVTKMLAQQSKELRSEIDTKAVAPSKNTGGDLYSVSDSLVSRNLLPERGTKKVLGRDNKAKITQAYKEARDLMWQAGQAIKNLDSSGAASDPEMLKKQEELMTSFFKALAPFRKIVEYKDKSESSRVRRNVDELIKTLNVALEAIKHSELVSKLPMGVNRKENGAYTIDLSHFEPSDLARLNLSRLGEFTFDVSNREDPKYSHKLLYSLSEHKIFVRNILREAYLLKTHTYSEHVADLYKDALKFYATLQLYTKLDKTDLKISDLGIWVKSERKKASDLLEYNRSLNPFGKSLKNSNVYDSEIVEKMQIKQYDNSTLIFLYSDNRVEREIADEMVVTHAYHDLWAKYQVERPDTEEFNTDYARTQGIIETRIENIKPEDREGFLNNMREVNQSLSRISQALARAVPEAKTKDSVKDRIDEEDLNPFQLALKKAIVATNDHDHWASKQTAEYEHYFDFDDPLLQDSMKRVRITKEDVAREYQDFLKNEYVRRFIGGESINNRVYTYSSVDALKNYEELVKANAKLKHRYDLLRNGIPLVSIPNRINGREVYPTPGNRLNCLIHGLTKVSNPEWEWPKIVKVAAPIRDVLVNAELAEDDKMIDMNELLPVTDDMVDIDQTAGQRIITELTHSGGFEPSRGLWIYQFRWEEKPLKTWRMQCNEVIPRTETNPDKPPYALRLRYNVHFDAMSEPKKR